jgi:hypothetical protein
MDETRDSEFEAMDQKRDTELGRQLVAFGEPEHGPDYWREVRQAVAEAKAGSAAETAAAVKVADVARGPGLGRRLRDAFVPRRARLALAAVAVAAVTGAALLVGLPGTQGPQTVSAAEVLDRALAATYSSVRTWQADLHLKSFDAGAWRKYHAYVTLSEHLVSRADGSRREVLSPITVAGHRIMDHQLEVYDATTGIGTGYDGSEHTWGKEIDIPLGPPDAGTIPLVDVAATVRAAASASTLRLDETVVDGRPAWTVTCTKGEMAGLPPSGKKWPEYTVVVDKETWLLLGVQEYTRGRLTFSARFSNVRVNEPLPEDAFSVKPPPGAPVGLEDGGFHRMTLDEAAVAPGLTALVPGFTPEGYALSQVAVAERSNLMIGLEDRDATYKTWDVFALQYARGFDRIAVSTRRVDDTYSIETDLCETFDQPWSRLARTEIPITSGAFAGATSRILAASTTSAPHLWAMKDGVLLTIAGAASAEELLAVAESLQVYAGPTPAAE